MAAVYNKVLGCALIVTLLLVATAPVEVESVITCGTVLTRVSSCIGYVQGGGAVTPSCCDGLNQLNDATKTTPDLQAACRCLTALIPSVSPNPSLINSLPVNVASLFPTDTPLHSTALS